MIEIRKNVNLDHLVQVESLHGVTFSNENKGHKFIVSCMSGGELETLTGTVTARFMRANNTTILIAGNDYTGIADGKAVVTLPQDCYNVPGRFQMAIFLSDSGTTNCIYACVGSVQRTQEGTLIDSGDAVPTLTELLAQIDACEQATTNATTAASAANAAAESASTAGDSKFIRYDTAQSLTANQQAQARANIGASTGAVLYSENQALTDAQKTVARNNTGAASATDVDALKSTFIGTLIPETVAGLTYTRQYIRDTGVMGTSTTTCSAWVHTAESGVLYFAVPTGFKISAVAEYTQWSSSTFIRFIQKADSTSITFIADSAKYYVVSVRKTDNSTITLDDVPADAKQYTIYIPTDKTMSLPGKAADAKAVGDIVKNIVNTAIALTWWQGTLTTTGNNQVSDNRIRTRKISYLPGSMVSIGDGFKFSYRAYDASGTFVVGSDWITSYSYIDLPSNVEYIRFVCAYSDDAQITPDIDTGFTYYKRKIAPIAMTKRASFRGNVSIRAAKVINFTDGTPPIIDWYLLQNTANEFYMSKDLVTKQYLFTFTPPSGNVADWSAGITAGNDIVFVADAGGLTAETRLSDGNRINPVCYLASENYSTMHVIDFGTDKKPCGWLENVGYCMLPNGNIVFCEYTRGTVATANVWVVSGDVSDPANWQTTWTENIIDVLDTTTAGIKHCHQVQYDFYTGVLYFGTGDSPAGSYSYYSTDNGLTWTLLYGPDKNRCRLLTYIFTENKVYWASDSHETDYHHLFVADRDANGLIEVANATQIDLDSTNHQACYGCVYVKQLNCIVMMDRCDGVSSTFNWYCYDIGTNSVKKIGEFHTSDGSATYLGFRAKFVDWYPRSSCIAVGFNPASATGATAQDTNRNPLCGNGGGATGDGGDRINNLMLHIYKNGSEYSYMADTLWI